MRPFAYQRSASPEQALAAFGATEQDAYLAGGTTLIDLMKLDVLRPQRLIDVKAAGSRNIVLDGEQLHLGAGVTMAQAANQAELKRRVPMLTQSLALAASTQIRNMASLGGNVLQRTRCPYYRDVSWTACNRRDPGSGCAALESVNRMHAVLGTSQSCIATYPGDFAQALMALEAEVEMLGPDGARVLPFAELHRLPGDAPQVETNLRPGELITGFSAAVPDWMRRSLYLKIRDRDSYEFALASAAIALDIAGGAVRAARIALGGVATVPWRAREAEAALIGKPLDEARAAQAAEVAFAEAVPLHDNGFKVELGRRTLVRGLLQAARMET